jgi:hypothetical protein
MIWNPSGLIWIKNLLIVDRFIVSDLLGNGQLKGSVLIDDIF